MSEAKILDAATVKALLPSDTMIARGNVTNFDVCLTTGTYQVIGNEGPASVIGLPPGAYHYGNLVVYGGSFFKVQEYYPHQLRNGYARYQRLRYDQGTTGGWGAWVGITGTVLSTA